MPMSAYDRLVQAAHARPPIACVVLGSGLNEIPDAWPQITAAAFHELPGLPRTTVAGHRGRLALYAWLDRSVMVFQGRVHYYEGHAWELVVRPVHIAAELGVSTLILTNASGGIGPSHAPGTLMLIRDQLEAMVPQWWRAPTRVSPFAESLRDLVREAAVGAQEPLSEGVYACVTGPNYETPAEVRALRACGAAAVGMSTAYEARTAAAMGMRVAGLSCVANWAAGISSTPLSHHEVLATVQSVAGRLGRVLTEVLNRIGSRAQSERE